MCLVHLCADLAHGMKRSQNLKLNYIVYVRAVFKGGVYAPLPQVRTPPAIYGARRTTAPTQTHSLSWFISWSASCPNTFSINDTNGFNQYFGSRYLHKIETYGFKAEHKSTAVLVNHQALSPESSE